MKTRIALLRGINVGGKNALPMKELVELFYSMGCENVQTYIQSGNVVFASRGRWGENEAENVRKEIFVRKGFAPNILFIDEADFHHAIEENPFPTGDGRALHFFFLDRIPNQPNLERMERLKAASEAFALVERAFYLLAPDGIGRSKLVGAVESALGVVATARNWNTVKKLASMLEKP